MATRERDDQFGLSLDADAGGVFGAGGAFSGSQVQTRIHNANLASADYESIANESYRVGGGSHGNIPGLAKCLTSPVTFDHYVEGYGAAVGSGSAATDTPLVRLLEACAQQDADSLGGALSAGTPSTTVVDTATPGSHVPSGVIGLAGFQHASGVQVRPYYCPDSDTQNLLMALSAAPNGTTHVIYGGLLLPFVPTWSGAPPISLGMRFLGNSDSQHAELKGAVGSWSIGEVGPAEVPKFGFSFWAASFAEPSATRVSGTNNLATVSAGGEYLIGAHQSTVPKALACVKVGIEFRGTYVYDPDANAASGCAGFTRNIEPPIATLMLPLTDTPPGACTDSTYRAMQRSNQDEGNDIQLLIRFGTAMGRTFACYFPHARVENWERGNDNGIAMQKMTIVPVDEPTYDGTTSCEHFVCLVC